MSKGKTSKEKRRKKKVEMKNVEMKNVERKKCRINRKSCLMLIMKYLFDFNEKKRKIRLLQMTNLEGKGVRVRVLANRRNDFKRRRKKIREK